DDARDPREAAGTRDGGFVADTQRSARDGPGKTAKIEMRAIDPLDGETKRPGDCVFHDIDGFKIIEERRAAIPRRIGALSGNIVAMARRNRNGRDRLETERGGEPSEIGRDLVEASLAE